MTHKTFSLCGLILLYTVSAHVAREAPSNGPPSFENLFEIAGSKLKDLESTFLKAIGVENSGQLEQKVIGQGKDFAKQLDQWANDIKKETENLKDNASVKELRNSVDKAIEEFNLKHPGSTEDVKKYLEKANKGTEDIINKIKNLSESEEAKNIKDLSQKLIDSAASTFGKISNEIHQNIKQ